MIIKSKSFTVNGLSYTIRSAVESDAHNLYITRMQIDTETEFLANAPGEVMEEALFLTRIQDDTAGANRLFLVVEVEGNIVGYSRCEGKHRKRTAHTGEFGICILKEYWNYRMGYNLMDMTLAWADANGVKRIALYVLEGNDRAMRLYKKMGFEVEGVFRREILRSDGSYCDSIAMARLVD